jgi:hypothetical protein
MRAHAPVSVIRWMSASSTSRLTKAAFSGWATSRAESQPERLEREKSETALTNDHVDVARHLLAAAVACDVRRIGYHQGEHFAQTGAKGPADPPPQIVYRLPGRIFSISRCTSAAISSTSALGILATEREVSQQLATRAGM